MDHRAKHKTITMNANLRLAGSLALSLLYFLVAVGVATVKTTTSLAATADPITVAESTLNSETLTTITTGRSLAYNLLVASGLSILTTYFFLRRHREEHGRSIA